MDVKKKQASLSSIRGLCARAKYNTFKKPLLVVPRVFYIAPQTQEGMCLSFKSIDSFASLEDRIEV